MNPAEYDAAEWHVIEREYRHLLRSQTLTIGGVDDLRRRLKGGGWTSMAPHLEARRRALLADVTEAYAVLLGMDPSDWPMPGDLARLPVPDDLATLLDPPPES